MTISYSFRAAALLVGVLFVIQCNDPILVGGELLDPEKLNLGYSENFDLSSTTIEGERIPTHIPTLDSKTYLLGRLSDPVFGDIEAELYFYNVLQPSNKPTFTTTTAFVSFDSLVLVLQLDTAGTYGAETALHRFELYQLANTYRPQDTFYSDTRLDFIPGSLVNQTVEVRPKDSVSYVNHVTREMTKAGPQLRLRLDEAFGLDLFRNNEAATNDTAFVNFIKGFYLRAIPQSGSSIFGVDLSNAALGSINPINRLILHYTENDTIRKTYEYPINFATINRFVHNRNGSLTDQTINMPEKGDSISYIQGIGGVKSTVRFNDLSFLADKNINNADLEITIAEGVGVPGFYPVVSQLIASIKTPQGNTELIGDIFPLVRNAIDFRLSFGGGISSSGGIRKYRLNITNHIKRAVKEPAFNADIIISPALVVNQINRVTLTESSTPARSIIYGAKHSQYPIRLKVTYTEK
jgi:hypothetical protein